MPIRNSNQINRNHIEQTGFSLIEMMLALVLGMIVTGSVLKLMVSNSRSTKVNEFMAVAQENGRHSLYVMSREFRKAGYKAAVSAAPPEPFYRGACEGNPVCTVDGGGTDSDRVAIQYEPVDGIDCTGSAVASGAMTADVYFVAPDSRNNNINTLFCRGYDPITAVPRGRALALVQGVERLQAAYGVGSAGTGNIDQYVTATAVTDWKEVLAMRIGVLVSAGEPSRVFDLRKRTYNLLNSGVLSFNDQTPRYMFSTAIRLNNTGL